MIHVLWSKLKHSPGRFLLLFSALLLAMLFLSLGMQLYRQSVESAAYIEENTTTIALFQNPEKMAWFDSAENIRDAWMTQTEKQLMNAASSSAVMHVHKGTTVAARIQDIRPVFPRKEQYSVYGDDIVFLTERMNLSAFRIRVTEVLSKSYEENTYGVSTFEVNGEWIKPDKLEYLTSYTVRAKVLENLVLNMGQYAPVPDLFTVTNGYMTDDGKSLLEVGGEYIIICDYNALPPEVSISPKGKIYRQNSVSNSNVWLSPLVLENRRYISSANYVYTQVAENHWQGCAKLPASFEAFPFVMETGDPRAEKMLELTRLNSELVDVTGISTVNGLPVFAWEDGYILEGRDINKQDNEQKKPVCLVSQAFAKQHLLSLGDTLSMDMYSAPWHEDDGGNQTRLNYTGDVTPLAEAEYEIVGIYQAPEWVYSRYTFSPNTIFVPESTIPIEGQTGLKYATSLILKNGSNEQFWEDVKAMGFPEGSFTVYDGGYTEFMDSLLLMQKDARLVMSVCILLFAVVAFSGLYMMTQYLKTDTSTMMKVGASRVYTVRYMLGCTVPVILLSAAVAYLVSFSVYAPLMEKLETWYALVRPAFSNLTGSSTGMLTGTSGAPSAMGVLCGFGMACLMTVILVTEHGKAAKG